MWKPIPSLRFDDRHVFDATIHLVGGGKHDRWMAAAEPGSLEDIQRPGRIDVVVKPWIINRRRHRNLGRQMVDHVRMGDRHLDRFEIPHISFDKVKTAAMWLSLQPRQVVLTPLPGERVKD